MAASRHSIHRSFGQFALRLLVVAVALWLLAGEPKSAWACPNCKGALAENDPEQNLARGFYYSILFMLSVPFLLITGFSTYLYVLVRRARRQQAAAPAPTPVSEPVEPQPIATSVANPPVG